MQQAVQIQSNQKSFALLLKTEVRKKKEQKCGKIRNFFGPHVYIHKLTRVAGNEIEDILSLFMHGGFFLSFFFFVVSTK